MREMRIWPQYAAKCCKNAGKFFPNVGKAVLSVLPYNYLKGIVKTIVAAYRIIIIPLKDLLL